MLICLPRADPRVSSLLSMLMGYLKHCLSTLLPLFLLAGGQQPQGERRAIETEVRRVTVAYAHNPNTRRLRQEDWHEFKISLGNRVWLCLKRETSKKQKHKKIALSLYARWDETLTKGRREFKITVLHHSPSLRENRAGTQGRTWRQELKKP